ncbi:hypothetical protein BOTBODRAFT_193250 [Botryobasidium botryosum FD-172 SS1]|uniref:Uncharacterized protein n=1 Tax=Botryobasidium botryosum (strain FD-172 SS1) TaxID=930990 RepID=A0A067LRT5_BOTB1|nr:hypothetical protein BOTBODRAFT_193250 [Botryobasidium botryosum FD-172 SS1]
MSAAIDQHHTTPPTNPALDCSFPHCLPPALESGSTFLALSRALPSLRAVNTCSCGIFIICLAALGLQSGGTIIVVDSVARRALLLAFLASGLAIASGSACYVHILLIDPVTSHIPIPSPLDSGHAPPLSRVQRDCGLATPLPASFGPSQLIYAATCTWISLAGVSLSVFMVRVAHTTSPTTSTVFFAISGGLSSLLLLFALIWRWKGGRPPPLQAQSGAQV